MRALDAGKANFEGIRESMTGLESQVFMDYTAVPTGWRIEGRLWSGHSTRSTETCPNCGRTGVVSLPEHGKRIVVHTGCVAGNTLTGIDYCVLRINQLTNYARARGVSLYNLKRSLRHD